MVAILRRLGLRAGERRVDQHLLAAAVDIGPAQAVRGGEAVDLRGRPGLARVAVVLQHRDHADAVLRLVGELAGQHDLGDAVAIGVPGRAVDHARLIADDDVPLPGRVLEPEQLLHAAGQRDQVGLAVVIHVGDDHLVAALQIGGERVLDEFYGAAGGQERHRDEEDESDSHDSV